MEVLLFTVFMSLLLAGSFLAMFLVDRRRNRFSSIDQDSLRPFGAEQPVEASRK